MISDSLAVVDRDILIALAGILLVLGAALGARRKPRASLPPGPKGLPLIGNVLDMPKSHEWYKFTEWNEQYGDIVHVSLLGQPIVILGSLSHAKALLDKRSTIYSDRPRLVMGGDLVGWDRTLALTPYGERFRAYRRLTHRLFGSRAQTEQYHALEERETKLFLRRVVSEPGDFAKHIRKLAGRIILMLTHGYEVAEGDDPIVHVVDLATEQFSDATAPGAFLVDVFPALRYVPSWMPGAGFQQKAREWKKVLENMVDVPHNIVKKRMTEGMNIPNFTSELLQDEDLDAEKEYNIKWVASSLYSGGSDTTVSAIHSFFLAMTLHPEIQKRAQEEINSVIGPDRLPSLNDRSSLPYVEAVVKEVLRWNPVGPLGVPHRLIEDDVYEGYLIPKGTLVIANIWKFLHDPEINGPNPYTFDPSRFLSEKPVPDPKDCVFGFGRRVCPGQHLADASSWIACAMALAVLDVSKAEENGRVLEPKVEYTSGTISHPKPFPCTIKLRSMRAEALLQRDN